MTGSSSSPRDRSIRSRWNLPGYAACLCLVAPGAASDMALTRPKDSGSRDWVLPSIIRVLRDVVR
jgi:hypothetical protein